MFFYVWIILLNHLLVWANKVYVCKEKKTYLHLSEPNVFLSSVNARVNADARCKWALVTNVTNVSLSRLFETYPETMGAFGPFKSLNPEGRAVLVKSYGTTDFGWSARWMEFLKTSVCKHAYKHSTCHDTHAQTDRHTHTHSTAQYLPRHPRIDRQTDRQTHQTDRQTDRQTHTHSTCHDAHAQTIEFFPSYIKNGNVGIFYIA